MPKVSDEYRAARRDEILDAALRAFTSKGLDGASMADIIAESGLSAGAIYGHFPSKVELLAAVAQRTLGQRRLEVAARQAEGAAPLTPGEVLATVLRGMRAHFDTRLLVQLWAAAATDTELGDTIRGPVRSIRETFGDAIRPWFAANYPADEAEARLARALPIMMALGQGFMIQRQLFDDFDEEGYLAELPATLPH